MNKGNKIKKREHLFDGVKLRENGEKKNIITGTAIVFNTPRVLYTDDEIEIREIISPEAVTKELLDNSDIKMTMFHDRHIILARSRQGKGTLSYEVTANGVDFSFEAPETSYGEYARSAVERGDICGCSFAFGMRTNRQYRIVSKEGERRIVTYTIKEIAAVYDFTLTGDPAYDATSVGVEERERLASETVENEKAVVKREKEAREAEIARIERIANINNI